MSDASAGEARVLLVVTGGIAAYKSCDLVRRLRHCGAMVTVVMTRAATEFVRPLTFETLSGRAVHTQQFPGVHDGSIDHIALARWAQVVAVAPATADFLARLRAGMADDLATAILLALTGDVPVLLVPAMNREMWAHPFTRRNVREIQEHGDGRFEVIEPAVKELACGEIGPGGFPEVEDVARRVLERVGVPWIP